MIFRSVISLLILMLLNSSAFAEKRVALVIGISRYAHAGELTNPKNDAADMVAVLKDAGIQVIEGFGLSKIAPAGTTRLHAISTCDGHPLDGNRACSRRSPTTAQLQVISGSAHSVALAALHSAG